MSDPTAVLIRLCRHLGAFEREVTCCGPVTVQQCVVLQRLADGADDVGGLASFVGASQPAMTRLVSGMEQREWVLRVRDPSDKRRVVVSLTPSGRREAARLRGLTEGVVDQILMRIPEAKRGLVNEALALIEQALGDARTACCGPTRGRSGAAQDAGQ